ncbi:hypothetical protein T552_03475 [Pneumocystis carinii B80]|uniref:GDP-mannose transporter n=1 Tax=Pneumocystis carinii (strain B80) TaxID=1408658 RepID=A0A0W4ZB15_PNEC8|nr:hypothetical protein T552_03475 [Pneumocystis carinii B80]KTW25615.1 hypothetical protein T552_03475 [Pneumocystis carinii B80]
MTIINKWVVTRYGFNLNFFMLIIQLLISIAILHIFEIFKVISLPKFTFSMVKQWFPISFLFITMIYTSSKALQFLSIPIYTIFKNFTIIITAYGEAFFMGGSVSKLALLSFFMMILSSLMIAWDDLYSLLSGLWFRRSFLLDHSFLYYGYLWIITNCICSSAYVLETRKKIKSGHFTDFDSMFYSNLLGIPILIICTLTMDDWSSQNITLNKINIIPIISILLSGIFSAGIGYTSLWCIRVTSSTTYSMIGALNKLPVSITGLVFFIHL